MGKFSSEKKILNRVQCDKETEIKEKLKQIIIEKNRLRLLAPKPTAQLAKVSVKLPQTIKIDAIPKVSASIPKPSPTVTEKAIDCVNTSNKDVEVNSPKATEKIVDKVKAAQMKPADSVKNHEKSIDKQAEAETETEIEQNQMKSANVNIDRMQPTKMDIDLVSLILFRQK